MEFVRPIFQSLFEYTTLTDNFLKSHICNTSCTEIHTLFAIFNNNELRNFKVGTTHSILKGIDEYYWKVFLVRYKCNEVGYTELAFEKK